MGLTCRNVWRFTAGAVAFIAAVQPAAADCIAQAAAYHGINIQLLQAIVMQESGGQPAAINCANQNKSCDYGLTQINSQRLPRLSHYGIGRKDLFNGCVAAYVGAWMLSENFARMGVTWEAVGAYNAADPTKRRLYAAQIADKVRAIQRGTLVPVALPMRPHVKQLEQAADKQVAQWTRHRSQTQTKGKN